MYKTEINKPLWKMYFEIIADMKTHPTIESYVLMSPGHIYCVKDPIYMSV